MTDSERAPFRRLPPTAVTIDDGFWSPRRGVNRDATVDHQHEQLEAGGCPDNFRRAAGDGGEFDGDLLGGVTVRSGDAVAPRMDECADELSRPADDCEVESASFTAAQYYAWANQEASAMRVWIDAAKGR